MSSFLLVENKSSAAQSSPSAAFGTMLARVNRKRSKPKKYSSKAKPNCTFTLTGGLPHMTVMEGFTSNQVYNHVTTQEFPAFLVTSNTVQTFANFAMQLANVVDVTNLTSVFDQYRVVRVQFWIVPRFGPPTSNTANQGNLVSAVDYDDNTNWTSFATGLEYSNSITSGGCQGHYHDFKPHVALAAYQGALTAFANEENIWIDCAYPNVYYYGLKAGSTVTDAAYNFDAFARVYLQFRNQR